MDWIIYACILVNGLAFGYPTPVDFNGQLLRWNITPEEPTLLVYTEIKEGQSSQYAQIVAIAMGVWNAVPKSFVEMVETSVNSEAHITIKFLSNIERGGYSSGFATFDQSDDFGPLHCSIEILATGGIAMAKTVLHEIGHCLGLGHSLIPQSIMSYEVKANKFALDGDDHAAISRLYPADGSEPQLPLGCAIGAFSQQVTDYLWIMFVIPFCPLLIRNRWRVNSSEVSNW